MVHGLVAKKALSRDPPQNKRGPGKQQRKTVRKIVKRPPPVKPIKRVVKKPTIRQRHGPARGPLVVKKGGKPFQILPEASAFQMPFRSFKVPLIKDGRFMVSKRGKTVKRGVVYPTHTSIELSKVARGPTKVDDGQAFWRRQKFVGKFSGYSEKPSGKTPTYLTKGGVAKEGLTDLSRISDVSRTQQGDVLGRLFTKEKVRPNEFTQSIPGYWAYPENTGFNPTRKWISLRKKVVKTKTKLVEGKAPSITARQFSKADRKRLLKGTGSKKMDTFFGASVAAGVGGVWEQFSDTISYNPLPFAAAAIGPGAAKPFLKSNKTLDLTNSLKSIWRKGHEGRVKKFQNLNELDKRIAHLDKELTAAKAGGDAYMKFTGKKGVGGTSINWNSPAPSTVNPAERDAMSFHKFMVPKYDDLTIDQKRTIDDAVVHRSQRTVGEENIHRIELEKMTLETHRVAWDVQKTTIKQGGPASDWMTKYGGKTAVGKTLKKQTGKKGQKTLAGQPPIAPKRAVTSVAGAGMPKDKPTKSSKITVADDKQVISMLSKGVSKQKPSADINIPGGKIKTTDPGSGKKGRNKSLKYMAGGAATIGGIAAIDQFNKIYPWELSTPPIYEPTTPTVTDENVPGYAGGGIPLVDSSEVAGGTVAVQSAEVEALLAKGDYVGAQNAALAQRGFDSDGNTIPPSQSPAPGYKFATPAERGLADPSYQEIQAARFVAGSTPGAAGSIQTRNQWVRIGLGGGATVEQVEAVYARQANRQELNYLHGQMTDKLNEKGGDILARAKVAQDFYNKNSAKMGPLPIQYKTILEHYKQYD